MKGAAKLALKRAHNFVPCLALTKGQKTLSKMAVETSSKMAAEMASKMARRLETCSVLTKGLKTAVKMGAVTATKMAVAWCLAWPGQRV